MNETDLENLCLDWFRDIGWEVVYGPNIAPDSDKPARDAYNQVILENVLTAAIIRLNPHLPEECTEQVLSQLFPSSLDLQVNNHAFHEMLIKGVPVTYKKDGETEHDHAFLIDFENVKNNRFQAINQFTVTGTKQPRRPDIICFVNGLPIAVLELKNPTDENTDIWDAFNQLQTYKDEIGDLFIFNQANVISDGFTARVGSLTANKERFMPWRTIQDEDDKPALEWELETMVRGFFNPELLLDYIHYFIVFEDDDAKIIKKDCRISPISCSA